MRISGMIMTTQTYTMLLGCALTALPLAYVYNLIIPAEGSKPAPQKWNAIDLGVVCLTGIGAIVFFYSGTFFHWNGLKVLFKTFHAWFETGSTGHGHEKAWYYWPNLIERCEWPACEGLILWAVVLLF